MLEKALELAAVAFSSKCSFVFLCVTKSGSKTQINPKILLLGGVCNFGPRLMTCSHAEREEVLIR